MEIDYNVTDRVGTLTFESGSVNALGFDDIKSFTEFLSSLPQENELVCIIRSGHDDVFYAGHDINDFTGDTSISVDPERLYGNFFETIYTTGIPIVASIKGPAVGAGAQMASLCDIRVGSYSTEISLPEINIGLVGGYGPLRRVLPDGEVRRMAFTGEPMTAERAYNFGFLTEVTDEPDAVAREIAEEIASKSPDAVVAWKEALKEFQPEEPLENQSHEQTITASLLETENTQEAIDAFVSDRNPDFE
jgi:enoyl-CoA hydratase